MFISVDLPAPFSPSSACTSPLREVEVDVVVGEHAREPLGDPAELEQGRLRHRAILTRRAETARQLLRGGARANDDVG